LPQGTLKQRVKLPSDGRKCSLKPEA
jgi:hypothetical protein